MQKIIIKNFGPIEFAEIEIAKIVVLIGEQASGKSTIGKLIYFFRSLNKDLFSLFNEEKSDIENYSNKFSSLLRKKFISFFPFANVTSSFSVQYFYSLEDYISMEREKGQIGINVDLADLFSNENRKYIKEYITKIHIKKQIKDSFLGEESNNERTIGIIALVNFIEDFFHDRLPVLYVPAGRNISVSYPGQFKLLFFGELASQFERVFNESGSKIEMKDYAGDMFLMREYLKEVEGILDYFQNSTFRTLIKRKKESGDKVNFDLMYFVNKKIEEILKGEYSRDSNGESLFIDNKEQISISLQNASSGQQEIIRILQDIFSTLLEKKNVFRVIEEPEAHLYPVAQKNVIELIATVVNNTDSQFILTTHSPYILSAFNNLLYATRLGQIDKSKKKEVDEIVSEYSQVDPKNFRAYSLKNISKTYIDDDLPYCQSIFDEQTGLISQNYLDEVSEELGDDFDRLYNIHKQSIK